MTRRNIFLGAFAAFFAVFLLDLLFGFSQERQLYCIFAKGGDFLADSLNHFRYAWNGDPYFDDSVSFLGDHLFPPLAYLIYLPAKFFGGSSSPRLMFSSFWAALCAFVALKTKVVWTRLFMIVAALIFVQRASMYYCVLFFYPAVAAFLGDDSRKASRFDLAFALGFAILLTPLQFYTPCLDAATLTKPLGHPSPIDKFVFSLSPFLATMLISLGSLALVVRHFAARTRS